MDNLKSYLPTILRYAILTLASSFATRGWISPEHQTVLGENLDVLVGSVVGILTVLYALWTRPSAKAMEVAKEVDKKIPAKQDVTIQTPGENTPNIVVPAKHAN